MENSVRNECKSVLGYINGVMIGLPVKPSRRSKEVIIVHANSCPVAYSMRLFSAYFAGTPTFMIRVAEARV